MLTKRKKKKSQPSGVDIDWYLISISTLKKYGLILVIIVGSVGFYLYHQAQSKDPRQRAQSAIDDARSLVSQMQKSPALKDFRRDFDRAKTKLQEAVSAFGVENYPTAISAAMESQAIAQAAIDQPGGEPDAQFLTVEGEVSFQKSGTEWRPAESRTPLYKGDWVKTGGHSTAELMFSNGSLYTIGQNALLEITSLVNPTTSKVQNTVIMQVGSIEVNTDDETSAVRTPGTQVLVESKSTTQVGVEDGNKTQVVSLRGGTSITTEKGGPPVRIAEGEKVQTTAQGTLSGIIRSVSPPALSSPLDNQVYSWGTNLRIDLAWSAQPGAKGYRLQVSRSRLFSAVEIDSERTSTAATVKPTAEGAFYWRVASLEPDGRPGPFSQFRRFRVTGAGGLAASASTDRTPPALKIKKPFKIGSQYYLIEGHAEPGSTVFVNEEEVDTDTSGFFKKFTSLDKVGWNTITVKAVDAAGNTTVERAEVFVEE